MGNGLLMPVIRVSQQTWERLQRHARPLEHTANDVVEMALNALEAQVKRGGSLHAKNTATLTKKQINRSKPRASSLSLNRLRVPLLKALHRQGGKAYSREIRATMERVLAPLLGNTDYELVSNGQPRWWNLICSMRNQLIADGLFRNDSPRGVWELTRKGLATVSRSRT
jgi:Mrr N-terminal domain